MGALATESNRLPETQPSPVGVFEDDVMLLCLVALWGCKESGCPNASKQTDLNDMAFEVASLVEAAKWDI